jgi:hypothetical protein
MSRNDKPLRVIREIVIAPKMKLELVLQYSKSCSRFLWLENGKPATNQIVLFERYNRLLKATIDELLSFNKPLMSRLKISKLLGVTYTKILYYFSQLKDNSDIKKYERVPFLDVFDVVADFMPIIEKWKTVDEISKSFGISRTTVIQRHESGDMESLIFLRKIRVSPIGVYQLRNILRSNGDTFEFSLDSYYSSTTMAKEVVKQRGYDLDDGNTVCRLRLSFINLMKKYSVELGVIKKGGRPFVCDSIKNKLCDIIRQTDAIRMLGITYGRFKRLIRKKIIISYKIGHVTWASYRSCLSYLEKISLQNEKTK